MTEAEAIARFIAERGVTKLAPGYAAPTSAASEAALPAAMPGQKWRRRWYGRDLRKRADVAPRA